MANVVGWVLQSKNTWLLPLKLTVPTLHMASIARHINSPLEEGSSPQQQPVHQDGIEGRISITTLSLSRA